MVALFSRITGLLRGSKIDLKGQSGLVSSAFYSVIGAGATKAFGFLSILIVARLVDQNSFGKLGILLSTMQFLAIFAGSAFGTTLSKFVSQHKGHQKAKAGQLLTHVLLFALIVSVAISMLTYHFSRPISFYIAGNESLAGQIEHSAPIVLFIVLNGALFGSVSGLEQFKALAFINISTGVTSFVATVYLSSTYGIYGTLTAMLIAEGFCALMLLVCTINTCRSLKISVAFSEIFSNLGVLRNFGVPVWLASVAFWLSSWFAGVYLLRFSNEYIHLAALAIVNQWFGLALFVPNAFGRRVLLPLYSRLISSSEEHQARAMVNYSVGINLLSTGIIFVLCLLFGEKIMALYGVDYSPYSWALCAHVGASVIAAAQIPFEEFLIAHSRVWQNLFCHLLWAVCFTAMTCYMVDKGVIGIGYARVAAYALKLIVYILLIKQAKPGGIRVSDLQQAHVNGDHQ